MWTKEEEAFLHENWGVQTLTYIANSLKRKETAIRARAYVLGLGDSKSAGGLYYTPPEVAELIGVNTTTIYNWIDKKILKARRKKLINKLYYQISGENLIEFLRENTDKWDSRNLKEYALGCEPDWLKEKRKKDRGKKIRNKNWTNEEDAKLINYIEIGYSMEEIAKRLNRTKNAIHARSQRLRKQNRLKPTKIMLYWTEEEIEMMLEMEKQGLTDEEIAIELGRERIHIADKRRTMREKGEYKGYKRSAS